MTDKFKRLSLFQKLSLVLTIALALNVMTFGILGLAGIVSFDFSNYFIYPSMFLIFLLNGIRDYKLNKLLSCIDFAVAAFLAVVFIIMRVRG